MKCHVYAFYNRKVGAYEKPIVNNYEKEVMVELVRRDCLVSDNAAKDRMAECQLYYLGTYDDATGTFEGIKPEFILDLGFLIQGKTEEKEEGVKHA